MHPPKISSREKETWRYPIQEGYNLVVMRKLPAGNIPILALAVPREDTALTMKGRMGMRGGEEGDTKKKGFRPCKQLPWKRGLVA